MATLEQIQARMKKLQAQAEALLAKRAQAAVDQIRELMLKHGLTTADIEARAKAKREARASGRRAGNGAAKHDLQGCRNIGILKLAQRGAVMPGHRPGSKM